MSKDTFNPVRGILEALRRFNVRLGERGEVGEATDTQDAPPAPSDWRDGIPEDVRSDPIWDKYGSQDDALRALVGAQKYMGREKLPVPKDENDKEAFDLIFKRLGLPENADGYKLPTDLEIPKEIPFDDNMLAGFKKVALENGILPGQFDKLYRWYMNTTVEQYNAMVQKNKEAFQEAETGLRGKWGAAYQQNLALAKKVCGTFADKSTVERVLQIAGNDPAMIELFANIGKVMSEDQMTGKPGGLTLTPAEAESELSKIRGDIKGPFYDETHPQHQEYVDKVDRLTRLSLGI